MKRLLLSVWLLSLTLLSAVAENYPYKSDVLWVTVQNYLESIDNYFFFIDRGYKTIRIEEYAWVYNNAEIKKQILSSLENVSLRDYFENSEFND